MIKAYLFDWGDTLMVDFPGQSGKMCDWKRVEAIDGAAEALAYLSRTAKIYVATGAADSTESDIERAFSRVGLDRFLSGYFCQANVGHRKGSQEFLLAILARLELEASRVAMVGDSLEKDITPAIEAGIQPVWLTSEANGAPAGTRLVRSLHELYR